MCYNHIRVVKHAFYYGIKEIYDIRWEVQATSRKCETCGKGQVSANNVSHSMRHTRRKWNANIQIVRIDDNGTVRRAKVCTQCLRSGKVNRAV